MDFSAKSLTRLGVVAANQTGYVEAMFQCMEAGSVAVPLRDASDGDRSNAARVDRVITPAQGGNWMHRPFTQPTSNTAALIGFTSGTEGKPKGVVLTHNNLADVVSRLNSVMHLDDDVREYIGVPVYHSFGFGRCRAIAVAGGQFFIPEVGFNPSEIAAMLKTGQINAISAVPSLWRVLLSHQELIGTYGKRVRWIEIGSQYMSRSEKEALKTLFPEARIVQHYGLTEASRTTLLEIHNTEGTALESVGQAVGSVAIKLTETGQIAIQGDHVAQTYLIDGEEVDLSDGDGWFVTKDLGTVTDGYLYYQGRADDVINCGGIKVHPEALETEIFASLGYKKGLAVCRQSDAMRGEGFLIAVTKEIETDRTQLREVVSQALQKVGVNAGNAITLVEADSLPTTSTGKVQRKKLAEWYATPAPEILPGNSNEPTSNQRSPIQTIFHQMFSGHELHPQDTFSSLGGDSLSYVQLAMDVERHLGYLPKKWEEMSIHELDQLVPQRRFSSLIETNILLRALAITGIVLNHSGFHFLEGGVWLLLLIVGLNFARFQGCALIQGKLRSILPLFHHLIVPYLIVAIAYQFWKQRFDPLVLLMLGNFESPEVQANSIFFIWFVANLVQTVILFSIPFKFRAIRDFAKASPWGFGIFALGSGILMRLVGPFVWDTSHLSHQVPHMLFWLFCLGWCTHFARSKAEKIATTILALLLTPVFVGFTSLAGFWLFVGASLLLWKPYISIPTMIKLPIQLISAASYYIYLTILIFITLVTKTIGQSYPLITMAVTLSGGVLTYFVAQSIQQYLSNWRLKKLGGMELSQY